MITTADVVIKVIVIHISAGNIIIDPTGDIAAQGKEEILFRLIGLGGRRIGDIAEDFFPIGQPMGGG